jgi:glycosyltransferase involved in cell wall biosynthesis
MREPGRTVAAGMIAVVRIAILGTRGVPGRYGGFETFADELSTRLVARGHSVTVYCRRGNVAGNPRSHEGVRLVNLPAIRNKYAETLSHALLSALHALGSRYDIVYMCNSANAPMCLIPKLRRQIVILNVDGLEWERGKWGRLARAYYRWAARLSARLPIELVTDALVIRDYYREHFHRATRFFPYGTNLYDRGHLASRLDAMELAPDGYVLYVSRLEPENNALLVVRAYRQLATDLPLVIVGDAPYAEQYVKHVKASADERVRFLGYRFGDDYHALQANARVYVQATEVGGTHPALVEALGHRNAVIAHDVPEHREVVGDAGRYFAYRNASDLTTQLGDLMADASAISDLRTRAAERVAERYSWDAVTDAYAVYFATLRPAA